MPCNTTHQRVYLVLLASCFLGCNAQAPQKPAPAAPAASGATAAPEKPVGESPPAKQSDVAAMPPGPATPPASPPLPMTETPKPTVSVPSIPKTPTPPATTPASTIPVVSPEITPFPVANRPEWPLIEAVRISPWDESAVAALAKSYAESDPPRSELVKLQAQLSAMAWDHSERNKTQKQVNELLVQNRARWAEPATKLGVPPERVEFQCGLIDEIALEGTTDEQLAGLANIPELRVLRVGASKITLKGFENIARLPQLDKLMIEEMELTAAHLAILETLPPWTSIRVYTEKRDPQAVAQMNERRIAKLDKMNKDQQYSAGVRFLSTFDSGIQFGARLTGANLNQAGVTDAEMRLLAPLTDLKGVSISESDITPNGIAYIAGMKDLQHLSLAETKVTSLESLAGLTKLESLEIYPDYDTKMSDAGLTVLENFKELNNLHLGESDFGDATVRRLSGLKKLRTLDLSLERLDVPQSLSVLAGLTELRKLTLHGPGLPDSVFEHLAGMSHLEHLYISVQKGTGEGLRHLAKLEKLTQLFLSGKAVTDDGIQHLSSLKQLEAFTAQGSAITPEGAKKLAAKLPHVTIVLDKHVVKSPRSTYTLARQRLKDSVSILLPQDWFEKSPHADDTMLHAREDGWKRIGGWSGTEVGPTEMRLYLNPESKTAEEAMLASVNNNSHLNPKILERNIVKTPGLKDAVSCLYQNDHNKYLVLAVKCPDGFAVLDCEAKPGRFNEFRPLFDAVAQSLRVDSNPDAHKPESVELPVKAK